MALRHIESGENEVAHSADQIEKIQRLRALRSTLVDLSNLLIGGSGTIEAQPVKVFHRTFRKGSSDYGRSLFNEFGFASVPENWRGIACVGETKGWELPKVAPLYDDDSRFLGSVRQGSYGIITEEGNIFSQFDDLPSIGGFAVYSSLFSGMSRPDQMTPSIYAIESFKTALGISPQPAEY
jgi:hypothetical protein